MKPSQTLVIAPNWVGDNVMAIPVLRALSASGRKLAVLARPHLEPLLQAVDAVSEVVVRESTDRATIRRIAARGFEEAVILPNSFRSAWIAFRAGIPVRWGYRGDLRGALLEPAVRRPDGLRHQVTDYDSLLERLGAAIPSEPPRLDLSESGLEAGRRTLTEAVSPAGGKKIVGVFPGAEFGPSKRWPAKSFRELVEALSAEPTLDVVLVAGPGEEALAETARGDTGVAVVGPDLDLRELASVLAGLDALVTNDSGPMHLAAAAATACVALFGPTNPARTAPLGDDHRVLYTNRWCSPCFRKRCPLFHQRCLRDLRVSRVVDTLGEVLAKESSA